MKPTATKTLAALLLAGIALTACAPPSIVGPSGPVAYRDGYVDGCNAGYNVAGSPVYLFNRRDQAKAPEAEEPYRSGWQQGFVLCQRSYGRIQNSLHAVFGPI